MVVLCHCVYKFLKLLYPFKKGSILISIKVRTTTILFISPHNYYKRKNIYLYIQRMIGVLAAQSNLKVKNAREPVALD